ncbi:MAG TPA: class I SAM-dependent methyltransferase [Polyangia bacterium]|jgi:23S rRNA (cytosine1962-C5)-methyltransferase|nr:class I SAM-dependent methyltransferase [Polyangia bacterium]
MALHGVALTATGAERLRERHPQLPLGDLAGGAAGLEPGRPLRLLAANGDALGAGVADPENDLIRVWRAPDGGAGAGTDGGSAIHGFDAGFFRAHVRRALALRRMLGLADGVSAYRLLNGEGDGLPALAVDVYGPYAVVTALSRGLLAHARLLGEAATAVLPESGLPLRGVVLKARLKAQGSSPERVKDQVLGEEPPAKLIVHENGVPHEVHLRGGINVGLFSDMRDHRAGLARFVRDRRVLNTFAYTGALSLAAARAGAASVTSVDLASGPLAWARENFRLSGLDPEAARFRWETSDVFRFLDAERARAASYDLIILDPPTVSGARATWWAQKRDYPELIAAACALLPEDGGHLWVSSNTHRGPSVLKHVEAGLALAGRPAALLELGGLPPDFPTPVGWPAARYLEVCQLAVGAGRR